MQGQNDRLRCASAAVNCVFVVTACEGREDISARTMRDLAELGGAGALASPKEIHWTGKTPPPFDCYGFEIVWTPGGRGNSRTSFFGSIRSAVGRFPGAAVVII